MKPRKPTIEQDEKQLRWVDAQDAADIVEWLGAFSQLCDCAQKAQSDEEYRDIVGILRMIDGEPKFRRATWRLMRLLQARFELDLDKLAQRKLFREFGKAGSATRQDDAEEWQKRIKPKVKRMLKAGKTPENIGALLAKEAGRSADHVADFARNKVKAELDQGQ